MAINIGFPFDTPGNYTYDTNKIEVTGGSAKLKLVAAATQNAVSDFSTPGDYTYNASLIDVIGGAAKLLDNSPANSTFMANYTSNINANWGNGTLTGTATGGAAASGGKLDLTGATVKYVDYSAVGNADSLQVGTIRFKYTPNYTGSPATIMYMFDIAQAAGNTNNEIRMTHFTNGQLRITMRSDTGNPLYSGTSFGVWSPTSGTEYELELNWDLDTPAVRIFIDGVQFGSTQTTGGTRAGAINLLRIGSGNAGTTASNFKIDEFIYFSTVQHTANFTGEIPRADYSALRYDITNPTIELTADEVNVGGNGLFSVSSFTETATVTPPDSIKYVLSKDGGVTWLYWSGSAWVASSGFGQSNTLAQLNANIAAFDFVPNRIMVMAYLHSDTGNTTPSLDEFQVNYEPAQYPLDNPDIVTNTDFSGTSICGFSEFVSKSGNDNIKYQVVVDGINKWWNGANWTTATGYSQTNTAGEIQGNGATILPGTSNSSFKIRVFIHSDDGTTTPSIENIALCYEFLSPPIDPPSRCIVSGTFQNSLGQPEESVKVSAVINAPAEVDLKNIRIPNTPVTTTTNQLGQWNLDLVRSSEYDPDRTYTITFQKRGYENSHTITVPDQPTAEINDLVT